MNSKLMLIVPQRNLHPEQMSINVNKGRIWILRNQNFSNFGHTQLQISRELPKLPLHLLRVQ
jgi:hypothetical protein